MKHLVQCWGRGWRECVCFRPRLLRERDCTFSRGRGWSVCVCVCVCERLHLQQQGPRLWRTRGGCQSPTRAGSDVYFSFQAPRASMAGAWWTFLLWNAEWLRDCELRADYHWRPRIYIRKLAVWFQVHSNLFFSLNPANLQSIYPKCHILLEEGELHIHLELFLELCHFLLWLFLVPLNVYTRGPGPGASGEVAVVEIWSCWSSIWFGF